MRYRGTITSWNDEKGFGFITPEAGGRQVFVHISAFRRRRRRPTINQSVTFVMGADATGRPRAQNVTRSGIPISAFLLAPVRTLPFLVTAGALVLVAFAAHAARIPWHLFFAYMALSIVSFVLYGADKRAAKRESWRTPEAHLHLVAMLGGWPGALVAQRIFRHKTRKVSFQVVFWITVLLNCGVFAWSLTPEGAAALKTWLARVS